MNTLQDLFLDALADMYYAEKQLTKALPKMAKAATHEELREGFEAHLTETEGHMQKLERIFEIFGEEVRTKRCPAILGIIDEAEVLMAENKKSPTINAALIYGAQKVEHYEIGSYGTLREWARLLGREDAARLIDEILAQEKAVDAMLNKLAMGRINQDAQSEGMKMAA